jgi:hypothetical protein
MPCNNPFAYTDHPVSHHQGKLSTSLKLLKKTLNTWQFPVRCLALAKIINH